MINRPNPDVEAQVPFFRTKEGGRQDQALSSYRPQCLSSGEGHDTVEEFIDKEKVYPGETVTVHLHFSHPELLKSETFSTEDAYGNGTHLNPTANDVRIARVKVVAGGEEDTGVRTFESRRRREAVVAAR